MTSVAVTSDTIMRAADGTPLKQKLAQAQRQAQMKALALIAPLFLFIVISFLVPIGAMLTNAFYDPDIHDQMPQTVAAISTWDGTTVPGEEVFAAFAADMKAAPLLRAWLHRLRGQGVRLHMRHRWQGWGDDGALRFDTPQGALSVAPQATVLALEEWLAMDHDARWATYERRVLALQAMLADRPGLAARPAQFTLDERLIDAAPNALVVRLGSTARAVRRARWGPRR